MDRSAPVEGGRSGRPRRTDKEGRRDEQEPSHHDEPLTGRPPGQLPNRGAFPRGRVGIGLAEKVKTAQVSGFPRTGPTVVPPWYRLIRPTRPDRPGPWMHRTFWTL